MCIYCDNDKIATKTINGDLSCIRLENINGKVCIIAYSDGFTYYYPKYCPQCGKLIEKNKYKNKGYAEAYRVIENTQSNDFNNEPRYVLKKYDVDEKNNRMRLRGMKEWHKIMDDTIYDYSLALYRLEETNKQ